MKMLLYAKKYGSRKLMLQESKCQASTISSLYKKYLPLQSMIGSRSEN